MKSHLTGTLETVKFASRRANYDEYLSKLPDLGYEISDYLHYFPAFTGHMTLNRYLTLYEIYKQVSGIAGHIAEIGVFKGGSTLLFAKLVQLFEPESLTQVHGFDHFKGTDATTDAALQVAGGNLSDEAQLRSLIALQGLEHSVRIHNMDTRSGWDTFFEQYPHLRFKLVYLDSGTYDVCHASIKALWPRLSVGGIMVFDQFNNEVAPGETRAVMELLPGAKIEVIPNSWYPSAFIVKR